MKPHYSATQSRCACGHKIVLVDGHWQHANPHPEAACTCTEPEPSPDIGMFRSHEKTPKCGIATLNITMERREGWTPGESA
jgi:hypothetical protein